MKVLKIVGGIVLALVVIIAIIAYSVINGQPPEGGLEDSIVINAPAESVYEEMVNIKKLDAWSPWYNLDPGAYSYEGPEEGVGAMSKWNSDLPELGQGSLTITEAIPNEGLKTKMVFGEMSGDFASSIKLEEIDNQTKVTWGYSFQNLDNVGRFVVGMMDIEAELLPMFEQGLNDLKTIVEAKPLPEPEPEVLEVTSDSTQVSD
ncbi:MAG: SRPBCC family protein [Bacteroidota bacterium]